MNTIIKEISKSNWNCGTTYNVKYIGYLFAVACSVNVASDVVLCVVKRAMPSYVHRQARQNTDKTDSGKKTRTLQPYHTTSVA